jgi:hypothetical protein
MFKKKVNQEIHKTETASNRIALNCDVEVISVSFHSNPEVEIEKKKNAV